MCRRAKTVPERVPYSLTAGEAPVIGVRPPASSFQYNSRTVPDAPDNVDQARTGLPRAGKG